MKIRSHSPDSSCGAAGLIRCAQEEKSWGYVQYRLVRPALKDSQNQQWQRRIFSTTELNGS